MKIDELLKMKFKTPHQKAIINLRITSNEIGGIQNKHMATYGLSMPQFNILRILRGAKENLTVNTIKERMVEKSPNTTRLLDKLVEKGLIARIPCKADKRQTYIGISEDGLKILQQIDVSAISLIEGNYGLTNTEAETLSDLLDKLRNNF
jgi:MarR family 2-MHQ and catechol resistance regulon transcriptional repressor